MSDRPETASLKEFLLRKAKEIKPGIFDKEWPDAVQYDEDTSPDAIKGDEWLVSGTSYIYKVGVLATWDSNKCDWVNVFIGHQRGLESEPEFIGHLYYQDGENDDIGRNLRRYLRLLTWMHPVFEDK